MIEMDFIVQPIDFLAAYLVEGFPISLRDSTCGVTIGFCAWLCNRLKNMQIKYPMPTTFPNDFDGLTGPLIDNLTMHLSSTLRLVQTRVLQLVVVLLLGISTFYENPKVSDESFDISSYHRVVVQVANVTETSWRHEKGMSFTLLLWSFCLRSRISARALTKSGFFSLFFILPTNGFSWFFSLGKNPWV